MIWELTKRKKDEIVCRNISTQLSISLFVVIAIPEDTWVRTRDFFDTDTSDSEDEGVLNDEVPVVTVPNELYCDTKNSITETEQDMGMDPVLTERDNSEMMFSTKTDNFNKNLDTVQDERGEVEDKFSDVNNDTKESDMDFISYAIQDVEIIDNVRFDDTDNSVLEDDFSVDELELWTVQPKVQKIRNPYMCSPLTYLQYFLQYSKFKIIRINCMLFHLIQCNFSFTIAGWEVKISLEPSKLGHYNDMHDILIN